MVVRGLKKKGEEIIVPGTRKVPGSNNGGSHSTTVPLPKSSPNLLARPRAQRKFAQGVATDSPPITPIKIKPPPPTVVKKPCPISPPTKRPKTEDFLNFLCYRGTAALPKKLNFFNYPPAYERGLGKPSEELKSWKNSNPVAPNKQQESPSTSAISSTSNPASVSQRSRPNSTDSKSKESGNAALTKLTTKKKCSETKQKAEKDKLVVKSIRKSTDTVPSHKPRDTQIHEIEAKFALSALKLKYQEKRLANSKPNPLLSTVNKLTKSKNVKDRRVILTRSKSKDDKNEKPSSSKTKVKKNPKRKPDPQQNRRNAPSPDIIDGLRHRKFSVEQSSSSESSSSSSDDDDDDKSTSSDEESSKEEGKTVVRSLRSGGKSFVVIPKKKLKRPRKRLPSPRCVSTRASRRNSTSPLRELPMYGVLRKRKKLRKIKTAILKRKMATRKEKEKETTYCDLTGRPTRKTKEYASIFFELLSKEFSSDDNDVGGKSHGEDSSGDTSSSETKMLENQYKASLKRDEQKEVDKRKKGSTSKPSEKKKLIKNLKKMPVTKKAIFKKPGQRKFKVGDKRILRSQSNREESPRRNSSAARVTRRRVTVPISPCDKPVHAGAARKSASIVPRKNTKRSTSSSSTSSSSSSSSSDSDSEESEAEEPKAKKEKVTPMPPRRRRTVSRTAETSSRCSNDQDMDSESDKEESIKKPLPLRQRSFSTSANETAIQAEVSQHLVPIPETVETIETSSCSSTSDSDSDSTSSEEERVVEKVEIAIQVDMDLEENMEQEQLNDMYRFEEHTPTPPFTSQPQPNFSNAGCQSTFNPIMSMPMPMPAPPPPPMSMSMPMPHAIPLPMSMSMPMSHPIQIPQQNPHHQPQPSFIPYAGPSFYPTLSNVEFVAQQRTQQEFSLMLPTLSLPNVSGVPTYNFAPCSTVLPQNSMQMPMCFSSTSISAETTLQTHIRSVAANLDIPLVRPVVTPNNMHNLSLTRPVVATNSNRPLTRPIMNVWSENRNPQPNYSAFRVPISTGTGYIGQQRLIVPHPPTTSQAQYSTISSHNQNQFMMSNVLSNSNSSSASTPGYSMHNRNIQPVVSRPVQNHPSTSTGVPGLSAHGLSLIQSLPNVSIVPKFDRTTKTVIIPPDQKPSSSTSALASVQRKPAVKKKEKEGPPKEKGRKRKSLSFPEPSSPLTVRKDTTPVTYVGTSSKKTTKVNHQQDGASTAKEIPIPANQFTKLLELKKSDTESPKEKQPRQSKKSDSDGERRSESGDSIKSVKSKKLNSDVEKPVRQYKKSDGISKEKVAHQSKKINQDVDKQRPKKSESESPRPDSADRFKSGESEDKGFKVEDAPAFYPTDEEFQDPLKYISQIQAQAKKYGMARIVPPRSFRPECNVEDDMRFTAYNHYIHRMYKRWGPNVQERVAMLEHLRKSKVDISTSTPPMIGGMEIDLTTLYHTVQSMGGLTEVIQKDKWNKVSDAMHIPKAANDRASKLDAVYVKYVLPYEMLSENERKKLLNEVEKKWKLREKRDPEESESESEEDPFEEVEDSIVKGKSTPLSAYYRVARNTLSMIFKNKEPSWSEVESSYWKLVRDKDRHFCVYSGSIDCAGLGWGFPLPKPGTKHPWNLKVLANSPGSILKSMGPVMGATVPTLHVGMVYTTYCWYRDPHGLSWVEYLHSGGNKIWYVVPASHEDLFRKVLLELMPRQCRNKKIWLTSDSAMVPPELLLARGVPLYRVVQNPGEFLVVFPRAFTSAICTGYVISESVCFALPEWLRTAVNTFNDIRESKEPPVFALERLLINIMSDSRVSSEILNLALPLTKRLIDEEIELRKKIRDLGVGTGKMTAASEKLPKKSKKEENELHECDTCSYILHLSLVNNKTQELVYCLPHALQYLAKNKSRIKASQLLFDQSDEQLRSVLEAAQSRLK